MGGKGMGHEMKDTGEGCAELELGEVGRRWK